MGIISGEFLDLPKSLTYQTDGIKQGTYTQNMVAKNINIL